MHWLMLLYFVVGEILHFLLCDYAREYVDSFNETNAQKLQWDMINMKLQQMNDYDTIDVSVYEDELISVEISGRPIMFYHSGILFRQGDHDLVITYAIPFNSNYSYHEYIPIHKHKWIVTGQIRTEHVDNDKIVTTSEKKIMKNEIVDIVLPYLYEMKLDYYSVELQYANGTVYREGMTCGQLVYNLLQLLKIDDCETCYSSAYIRMKEDRSYPLSMRSVRMQYDFMYFVLYSMNFGRIFDFVAASLYWNVPLFFNLEEGHVYETAHYCCKSMSSSMGDYCITINQPEFSWFWYLVGILRVYS